MHLILAHNSPIGIMLDGALLKVAKDPYGSTWNHRFHARNMQVYINQTLALSGGNFHDLVSS